MNTYPFYLVNVFAESHFGGNPLAVFPKADGLNDEHMRAIAKQFNLSETVFIFAPTNKHGVPAVADLRIFTPDYELPLAGHPTLGASLVLSHLAALDKQFVINTVSKPVHITTDGAYVSLMVSGFDYDHCTASCEQLAQLTGLTQAQIDKKAFWINSGTVQLFLKVANNDALQKTRIDKTLLENITKKDHQREQLCLWTQKGDDIVVRFFFIQNGAVVQDSGTGSACANLGAYFIAQNQYPMTKTIYQGDDMGRPNRLSLKVDDRQNIYVGGQVIEVGKGEFFVP